VVSTRDTVLRFRPAERHLHWAIAIPFKVCYLTAVILVIVYNPEPTRPLRQLVSWIHRGSGVCLGVLPLATILWHRREFAHHLDNIRRAWSWTWDDLKWLALMGVAAVSPRIVLPHQGKFNAAEKINFMVLTVTYPVYLATGVTIWFFGPALVAWLMHFSLAMAATPLVFGHVFMATVNPDTRIGLSGMISGYVDRRWARHHYRHWYDEHHAEHVAAVAVPEAEPEDPVIEAESPRVPEHAARRPSLPGPSPNPSLAS
jgi:formate dehydrogenase subunit gamma